LPFRHFAEPSGPGTNRSMDLMSHVSSAGRKLIEPHAMPNTSESSMRTARNARVPRQVSRAEALA